MSEKEEVVVEENVMEQAMPEEGTPVITMKKLLEAGAHFGHPTRRWNPKMQKYIFGARNGVYIIDLQKTAAKIEEAYAALKQIVLDGGKVLFVGTRKQVQEEVIEEANRSGSFYITNRWLGGTLTNFKTLSNSIRHLKDLEKMADDGTFDVLPKKEVALLKKEQEKLMKNLEGIKEMRKVPNAIIVVDPRMEHNAVAEGRKLGIPVFGICDTNADPDEVDYAIPANDDAIRSVHLILAVLADAIVEAKGGQTIIAYTKDEDDSEVSMNDALKEEEKKVEEDAKEEKPQRRAPRKRVNKEETAPKAEEEK